MGGKGRGVFSDFRLGRVRDQDAESLGTSTDNFTVSIPYECARWKIARCEEGKLVEGRERKAVIYVYTTTGDTIALGGVLLAKTNTDTCYQLLCST